MEEQWVVDRCKLREVWLEHPEWSKRVLAEKVGRSKSWVKKWLKRICGSTLEDREVLNGHSRARKRPPAQVAPEVVNRILEIRDHPPQKLGRTPGPLTILYYLNQDKNLTQAGVILPRSTRTIWKILDRHHRILRPDPREHKAEERPEPGVEWGMDFHDVSSVPADPEGKQQHVVEILNLVDHGSSAVVASEPAITPPRRRCGRWRGCWSSRAAQTASAWIAIPVGWAVGRPKIFHLPCCVFSSA